MSQPSNASSEQLDDRAPEHQATRDDGSQEEDQLTLRALVTTKEAGVIIGKGNFKKVVASMYSLQLIDLFYSW